RHGFRPSSSLRRSLPPAIIQCRSRCDRRRGAASLRPLSPVLRTTLTAVRHALRIEDAADDMITNAGKVLDTAAADHDHGVLLKVMPLARDVADHLEAVRQTNL